MMDPGWAAAADVAAAATGPEAAAALLVVLIPIADGALCLVEKGVPRMRWSP